MWGGGFATSYWIITSRDLIGFIIVSNNLVSTHCESTLKKENHHYLISHTALAFEHSVFPPNERPFCSLCGLNQIFPTHLSSLPASLPLTTYNMEMHYFSLLLSTQNFVPPYFSVVLED